jgi:chaperone required for assembly of F1-ATPase
VKRFYREVTVAPAESGGWRVLLDGRGIKSVGGRPQVVPSRALAEALAEEWADQGLGKFGGELDPAGFTLRDMADYAIDVVAADRADVIRGLVAYAGTDTLCYRAEPDEPLRERQDDAWEPLLHAAEQRWDIHFERIDGVMHRPQPAATLARMQAVLEAESDFALAGLTTLTSLAASLVIALAALPPEADAEALWDAANLEEDWQAELWGNDAEAEARRERRFATFEAAMRFAALTQEGEKPQ